MDTSFQPLVSVIVPIYNVESYLRQCVDSILDQSYKNLEIILVDDGSPDSCGTICDEYARKDGRIIAIHKENGGLSDARNAGMAAMHGEYLMFVDSDDWLPADSVEKLHKMIRTYGVQLAIGSSDRRDDNGSILRSVDNVYAETAVLDKKEAMADMLRYGCSAWARLYHKSIHAGILFPKGEINEDEAIVLRILDRCNRVAVTEQVVYHYRCRPDSITTNTFSQEKLVWKDHCETNLRWIREHESELSDAAAERFRGSLIWSLSEIAMLDNDKMFRVDRQKMMEVLRTNQSLFDKLPFITKKEKLRYILLTRIGYQPYRILIRTKRRKAV